MNKGRNGLCDEGMLKMTAEQIMAYGALFTAIGTGIGALLNMFLTKGADAKVKIIRAQADADKETRIAELKAEKECTDELARRVQELEVRHENCETKHVECEKNLARLEGYMRATFQHIDNKVSKIESTAVIPVPVVVQPQKIDLPTVT